MQCARAIPVKWLSSGSCQARPSRLNTIYLYLSIRDNLHETKFTTSWGVRPYSLVDNCQRVGGRGEPAATIFRIRNEDSRFLWNVDNYLPNYTGSDSGNPYYVMPQLLRLLKVTANKDNYKSPGTTQHCQGRPCTVQFRCDKPIGCKLGDPSS